MELTQEFRTFLHNFIESLPYGVMILDKQGAVLDFNRNISLVFGLPGVDGGKVHYSQILEPKIKTLFDQIIQEVTSTGFVMGKEVLVTLGSEVQLALALSASRFLETDPARQDVIIICREMTARQELDRLRELERLKTEFISSITHDLKAPLTSVIGYADLLMDTAREKLDKDETEYVGIIKQEGMRLSRMINDILNVAKIDSGKLALKAELTNIKEIVDEVLKIAQGQGQHFTFSVQVAESLPPLWLDKELMTRVIMNLVSNAIKYSPHAGQITICVYQKDADAYVDVIDQGMGMSEESLRHLFEKFFRVRTDATKGIAGTGLGLVITKGFIEAHGGTIKVASVLGKGSTFSVVLPLRLAEHKPES